MGTKLTKISQRIFASQPGLNQITKFGSLAAGALSYTNDAAQVQSLSNWLTGWFGAVINGAAPVIQDMNGAMFLITRQIAYLQQMGIAEWDADTEYFIGSIVQVSGVQFVSRTNENINHNPASDATNWKLYSAEPAGIGKDFWGSTLPAGYVWANGQTIGNAGSGSSGRANADTLELFTVIWTDYSDADQPIYDATGVLSARGASAAADFAALKRLTVIDRRGFVSAGRETMGGTSSSARISTQVTGSDTLGKSGGSQSHTLTVDQTPAHQHVSPNTNEQNVSPQAPFGYAPAGSHTFKNASGGVAGLPFLLTSSVGGGLAHNNVQPTKVCNYILKL